MRKTVRLVLVAGALGASAGRGLAQAPETLTPDLARLTDGRSVALFVGNGSDGAFADLRITPTAPAGPPPASTQK